MIKKLFAGPISKYKSTENLIRNTLGAEVKIGTVTLTLSRPDILKFRILKTDLGLYYISLWEIMVNDVCREYIRVCSASYVYSTV